MRPDDDYDSDDHHHRRLPRMVSDVPDRAPREGADRDHDHDRHQRGHRNDRDQRAEHEQQEQQENARYEGREPSLAARLYVDDRLADHGAAAHAAKEAGEEVSYALALRSEEHKSELQSLMRISYAGFCLKKKKNNRHARRAQ